LVGLLKITPVKRSVSLRFIQQGLWPV